MNYSIYIAHVRIDYDGSTYCDHCGSDIVFHKDAWYREDYCPNCGYYLDFSEVEEDA